MIHARPEARWAFWCGVAGALATAALSVKGIFSSGSSTAALGFITLPLVAALGAIPVAAWGAALGHVVLRWRGKVQSPPMVLVAALAVAASLPAAVATEISRGLRLEAAVREVRDMDVAHLGRAFEESPFRQDRYFLGAIAQNPAAQGDVLGRIAALRAPELYEPMGSLWDVMGGNRKGLAVIRLVARHPNTDAATLARLAAEPNAQVAAHELAANPRTPMPVLERWFNSTDYLVEWGLALNPNTPQRVMARLAASDNLYARMNLTYNKSTPREILERLARDPDETVARNAALAIERRKKGE
jgi:hypothetical protein